MSRRNRERRRYQREQALRQTTSKKPTVARRRNKKADRPWGIFAAIGGAILLFAALITVLDLTSGPGAPPVKASSVPSKVLAAVTHVSTKNLQTVGVGADNNPPTVLGKKVTLKSGGKPEVLYVGAEYCQYCALERWSLIGALSQFGKFSGLQTIRSATSEYYIATFTFAQAKYESKYLTFVPREMFTNIPSSNGYVPLQSLTATESRLFTNIGKSGFPFVDFGGVTAQVGSESTQPGPSGLHGYNWTQIAAQLNQPKSTVAQMILGGINYDTAAICKITNNRPGSVCDRSVVKQLEKKL